MQTREWLEAVSQVLWRCVLIGFAFLLIWAAALALAGDVIHRQAAWFGLTAHECDLIQYGALGLVKTWILVFFLFPYLAIRLVLRTHRK